MTTQPTALFLADILEDAGKPADIAEKAAAELRRLHAENETLLEALGKLVAVYSGQVQNDGGYTVLDSVLEGIAQDCATAIRARKDKQ